MYQTLCLPTPRTACSRSNPAVATIHTFRPPSLTNPPRQALTAPSHPTQHTTMCLGPIARHLCGGNMAPCRGRPPASLHDIDVASAAACPILFSPLPVLQIYLTSTSDWLYMCNVYWYHKGGWQPLLDQLGWGWQGKEEIVTAQSPTSLLWQRDSA